VGEDGPKLAQMALLSGANDFGGTLMEESISRESGADFGENLPAEGHAPADPRDRPHAGAAQHHLRDPRALRRSREGPAVARARVERELSGPTRWRLAQERFTAGRKRRGAARAASRRRAKPIRVGAIEVHDPVPQVWFDRIDPSPDPLFYSAPRLVNHIDGATIAALSDYYREVLPPGGALLDLMSSWVSHLPRTWRSRASRARMNCEELVANPRLTEHCVHDLNTYPALPYASESFDAVLCAVSVQYWSGRSRCSPRSAGAAARRRVSIVAMSHRCFPTKAVRAFHVLPRDGRFELVATYHALADGFEKAACIDRSPRPATRSGSSRHSAATDRTGAARVQDSAAPEQARKFCTARADFTEFARRRHRCGTRAPSILRRPGSRIDTQESAMRETDASRSAAASSAIASRAPTSTCGTKIRAKSRAPHATSRAAPAVSCCAPPVEGTREPWRTR
jgi:hypothetical protein